MSPHTPGPWTLQELPHQHDFREGVNYAVRDNRNCCLAQVGHVDAIHDGEESAANARLIAAAPDLLEALELYLLRDTGQWDDARIAKRSPEQITLVARAALAKAKGERT